MKTKRLIAVAWPYVNGDIHVGHLAGYLIPCDIFARYSRLKGYDTLMVSGTDCHGTPITVEADKLQITPQELVDEYTPKVHRLIELYKTSYDTFTSTTTDNHKQVTQEFFINLLENGYIIKQKTKQFYSEFEQKFLPDRYVEGECPHCHAKDQRSDQCESCGRSLGFGELLNPISKLTKTEVSLKETEHYFVDLPKLQDSIKEFVNTNPQWRDWVWKETSGWLNEGLQPRAITRDIDWGIQVPIDRIPEEWMIENSELKRFYVWFEAVIGYISAAKEYTQTHGDKDWQEFWFNKEAKHYYFMGKDNLFFHTIFWPSLLLGQNKDYTLPYFPCVNQNLNLEGQKFSKSRGIYLDAYRIGTHFGPDIIRFYIASIMPESKDANWKWEDFKDTINNELVGNIGNFIHRTTIFFQNKLQGTILTDQQILDIEIANESQKVFSEVSAELEKCNFVNALNRILKYSKSGNQYFDLQKPWVLVKEDSVRAQIVIYNCLQIVENLRRLLHPFIPDSMDILSSNLGLAPLQPEIQIDTYTFRQLDAGRLQLASEIKPLFKKVEVEDIENYIANS